MSFSFAKQALPLRMRVCRSLVWTQAALVLLGGAFVVFTAVAFGSASSIPFRGESLSGARAAALGAVYVVSGLALLYLGVEVGRHEARTRAVLVAVEVFLGVLIIFRSLELSLSEVLNLALIVAIVALLLLPSQAVDAAAEMPPTAP